MTGERGRGPEVEKLLSVLAETDATEPSSDATGPSPEAAARLEAAVLAEVRVIRTEREFRRVGLVAAYRFARHHLKEHFFWYLAYGAAALTIIARVALGSAFPRVVNSLMGGW